MAFFIKISGTSSPNSFVVREILTNLPHCHLNFMFWLLQVPLVDFPSLLLSLIPFGPQFLFSRIHSLTTCSLSLVSHLLPSLILCSMRCRIPLSAMEPLSRNASFSLWNSPVTRTFFPSVLLSAPLPPLPELCSSSKFLSYLQHDFLYHLINNKGWQ